MEDMKTNSRIRYERNRIVSGKEPHQMLKMAQEQALEKVSKERIPEEGDYSKIEEIYTEMKK